MGKQTELTLHLPQGPVQACGCRCLRTKPLHWTANLVQIQGRYWTKMNQLAREYQKINCQTICILLQFYSHKKIFFFFFPLEEYKIGMRCQNESLRSETSIEKNRGLLIILWTLKRKTRNYLGIVHFLRISGLNCKEISSGKSKTKHTKNIITILA